MHEEFDDERTRELLKSLRDPLRRRMLVALADELTIRQLATRLDEPVRRIRHQIDALVAGGFVRVQSEQPRRGTMERTFTAVELPLLWEDEWPGEMDSTDMKLFLLDILRVVFDDVTMAIAAGTFEDRKGWCATRALRKVDEQGWSELAEIHERAVRDTLAAARRAKRRLEESAEEPIRAVSSLLLFEAIERD